MPVSYTHLTTDSDGCLSPAQAVELFRSHGYHFLCLSDHDIYSDYRSRFNREDFILLPGIEASAVLVEADGKLRKKVHHMHGILGTAEMPVSYTHLDVYKRQWMTRLFTSATLANREKISRLSMNLWASS